MQKKYLGIELLIILLMMIIQMPLIAEDANRANSEVTALPKGVSIYQLDNGMQVLLIENSALPMVGVNCIVKVGSAYETFSTSGMCHMLEHLLFNGTTTRDQKQLYDDVDRIGGYNNASTAEYYTNYMMVTPTENILKGMDIQADMLFNSILPNEKFEKEKGIVLEEISKSLVNPQEQMERNISAVLFEGHALSLPTLGTYSTIQSMKRDDVNAFYKNYYVPNNMILSVIGNFQTADMLSAIKEIYGKASSGLVVHNIMPDWGTAYQLLSSNLFSSNRVFHRFYDGENIEMELFYPLDKAHSAEYYDLMNIVFDKSRDDIKTALQSEFLQGVKAVRISTRLTPIANYIEVGITLDQNVDFSALEKSVSEKLSKLNFILPPETIKSEVSKARTDFLKNIEKPHMFGIFNSNRIVTKGLEKVLASFSGQEYFTSAKEIESLEINSKPIIIIQTPSVKKEQEAGEISNVVELYRDETSGNSFIVKQNELSNLLAIHYLVKHKAPLEFKYGKDAAKVLHDCIEQRLTSIENQKISSQYGLTYVFNDNPRIPMDNIYLDPDFGYIRVEGLADDLPGVFNYLNNQFLNFVPTEEEMNKSIDKFNTLKMMSRGGDKARKLFDSEYDKAVYETDIYSENTVELTYDNLLEFTNEYFKPSNMIISIVSPAPPESIIELLTDFKSDKIIDESGAFSKELLLHDKELTIDQSGGGERSYLFWGFITQIDMNDAPALQALSLVLADDIIFDIREKQGMAYHMSAGIELVNDKAMFYINQGTRPQNVDILIPQYPKFFKMEAINALTEDELEKSINMYLGRMMFRRLSSINQAFYLGYSLYFNGDYNYDKIFLEQLRNIKLSEVKEVAKKYMIVKNPIAVIIR